MIAWLLTNAAGAVALALLTLLVIRLFRPGAAIRHALWLVVLLKLVSPGGWLIAVPLPVTTSLHETPEETPTEPLPPPDVCLESDPGEIVFLEIVNDAHVEHQLAFVAPREPWEWVEAPATTVDDPTPAPPPVTKSPQDPAQALWVVWLVGAVLVAWRQLRDTRRFARFVRRSHPATETLISEVAVVAHQLRVRVPNVRVLPGLASPVMWCLWQPVLLWPAGLDKRLTGAGRRAVIAHELAHLRRRDHWVRRVEMFAAVLHWWNPLFWLARKRLRADAEFACDAWAANLADRRAYAEALLEVCSFQPRHRPAPAVGVIGEGRRTMQERLTMIMKDGKPGRLNMAVKLLVALMAVAAIPAWTLGQGEPVKVTVNVDKTTDADTKKIEEQIQMLQEKLKVLRTAKAAESTKKDVVVERKIEVTGQALPKDIKVLTTKEGTVKVLGADGKEIKDIKVIVVDQAGQAGKTAVFQPLPGQGQVQWLGQGQGPAPVNIVGVAAPGDQKKVLTARVVAGQQSSDSVALARSTYKLTKEQAAALTTLLNAVKGTVMETKVDGDSLTVTTTPEAQAAIASMVRLVKGQPLNNQANFLFTPVQGHEIHTAPARIPPMVPLAPSTTVPGVPLNPVAPSTTVPGVPLKPLAPNLAPSKLTPPAPPAAPALPLTREPLKSSIDLSGIEKSLEGLKTLDAEKLAQELKALIEAKMKAEKGSKTEKPTEKK